MAQGPEKRHLQAKRPWVAFLVAPLLIPILDLLFGFTQDDWAPSLKTTIVLTSYTYLATGLLGLPAFLLVEYYQWRHWLLYFFGGAGQGLLTSWFVGSEDRYLALYSLAGGLAALLFRLLIS